MPPSSQRPWPGPRSRAARRTAGPHPLPGGEAPPRPHPVRILLASVHLAAFPLPGTREAAPPPLAAADIPGIAAHNCTFPGQERPPRWSSARPAALTCSRSCRARRAPAPPPSADSPSPRSPPPSVARALLAAGEGTGPRHVRPIAPSLGPPRSARRPDMASISTQRTKEILATGQSVGCNADGCHPHDIIDDINSGAVECPTG
ncbi:hypothetical protein R6Z07F_010044 [Ovis aries]